MDFTDPPSQTDYTGRVCAEMRSDPRRLAAFAQLKSAAVALASDESIAADYRRHLLTDQFHLAKWLRACDYNAESAVAMLRRHLDWRREESIDAMAIPYYGEGGSQVEADPATESLLNDPDIPELIRRYHTGGRCGSDAEGRPVFIDPIGRFDMSGLMRRHSLRDLVQSRIRFWERLVRWDFPAAQRRTGKPVCQAVYIIDLTGFGRRQMNTDGLAYARELARIMEAHYPELLGAALVLNPKHHRITQMIWTLIGPFLGSATRRAVQILPDGEAGKAALLAIVPPDQLPAAYGGELLDPATGDPACPNRICYGGPVPRD